jgi:putative RecB family exonuclease
MNMPLFANLGTVAPAVSDTPSLAELRKRPHWSFSRINGLVNYCSLAWAFRYVYKREPESRPASLVFGSAFHGALAFHANRRLQGKDCATNDYQDVFADLLATNFQADGPPVRFGSGEDLDSLIRQGQAMLGAYLAFLDPEEEVVGVGVPFSVPLIDASGAPLAKPLIGEYDLVVRCSGGIRTIVDWKTSARRWPKDKADTDLQATCYLWSEQHQGRPDTQFRFDVVTKTKQPTCEQHETTRTPRDFRQLGETVRILVSVLSDASVRSATVPVGSPVPAPWWSRRSGDCSWTSCRHGWRSWRTGGA